MSPIEVPGRAARATAGLLLLAVLSGVASIGAATELYRYRDANGHWQFLDRPPEDATPVERLGLATGDAQPWVVVGREPAPDGATLRIENRYACPVQIRLELSATDNLSPDVPLQWELVIDGSGIARVNAPAADPALPVRFGLRYQFVLGDPQAAHSPVRPYRVPYAATQAFPVSQGFNGGLTHHDPASIYAIDIAMPVGTGIFAARNGVVVEIAYAHYAAGTNLDRDGPRANIVRILHDDGTLGLYAHLDRASVRVRPGQRVEAGELIAASGNTGFSTGPHLHFAVLRNVGMQLVSVPFVFRGAGGSPSAPRQGELLTAYP